MLLAQKIWSDPTRYCEGWNFGPRAESISTVWDVATKVVNNYGSGELRDLSDPHALHEAKLLMLDISKAKFRLGWEPKMNIEQTVELTVDWYKRYREEEVYDVCVEQIVNCIQKYDGNSISDWREWLYRQEPGTITVSKISCACI